MTRFALLVALACLAAPSAHAADVGKTVALIEQWIGGNYSTQAQHEADQASNKPDTEKHRLMYQLFKRVDVPAFPGVVFFEQGSRDGSEDPDMIWRSGLVHIVPDDKAGVVRYRELAFKDQKPWHNAHKTPEKFKALTPDQVTWDEKCDFLVTLGADGREIAGPIKKMECGRLNEGTGEMMYAEDKIVIKPGEFWFLGRYVNAKGEHIWGNESDELNKLVKFADVP
ncbi:MAG: CpcT/CpeT family chromophore lyase [Rhodospirillaceae bacterium]|nr:CpcT/CpeT family chromophore lyase [Rhodospirillaceae bacterium]